MAFKVIILLATVALACGQVIRSGQQSIEPYDPNPSYSYTYSINDASTGDSKEQSESRHGDVVEGSYSFIEADGSRRIVDYTADPVNGFNAVVRKEALGVPTAFAERAYRQPIVHDHYPTYYH